MMKKVFILIVLLFIIIFGYQNKAVVTNTLQSVLYYSPCTNPRSFRIGTIDERFSISNNDFLTAAQEAGKLWKNAEGRTLFFYDPNAQLTISLVYDERQYLNSRVDNLNNEVNKQKAALKPEIAQYEQRALEFKKKNADLNARIDYWNNKGGAPTEEYGKLISEQKALQAEAQTLQSMAQSLNQSTDAYNMQVQELDKRVDAYNQTLAVKPEEGEYIRNGSSEKIILYFNNSRAELVHTLAHEMGHAIGVNHTSDPHSIMYPKTNDSTQLTNADIEQLAIACEKKSYVSIFQERFMYLIQIISLQLQQLLQKTSIK